MKKRWTLVERFHYDDHFARAVVCWLFIVGYIFIIAGLFYFIP